MSFITQGRTMLENLGLGIKSRIDGLTDDHKLQSKHGDQIDTIIKEISEKAISDESLNDRAISLMEELLDRPGDYNSIEKLIISLEKFRDDITL